MCRVAGGAVVAAAVAHGGGTRSNHLPACSPAASACAQACLAFFNLVLFSGDVERGVVPIDADDFLQTLRWARVTVLALTWR